jgi:sialidase-1
VWLSSTRKHRPSIASVIYSDDRGQNWHAGEVIASNTEEVPNPSEHVLVQLADGRVMSNLRNESPRYARAISHSSDGATGWSTPEHHEQLSDPICMASMTRLSGGDKGVKSRILFVNPDSAHGEEKTKWGGRERKNVTVRLSYDDRRTWPVAKVIEPGPSGYSDVAVGADGTVYLLFERTGAQGLGAFSPGFIGLAKFNLTWLTNGQNRLDERYHRPVTPPDAAQ